MHDFTLAVSSAEERRLAEFIAAIRTPCRVFRNPESSLNSEVFEAEFRTRLLAHHCFIRSPLFQESFDAAFISASQQAGSSVDIALSGQRFWDVIVDGRRISLKSSKAQSLRDKTLHISKLTEAAWIQDCRTASKRRDLTFQLFEEYCSHVDAIFQLRYFRSRRLYELVEVPVRLFRQVLALRSSAFAADGPTINIPIGKAPPDFTLKLDRSDAKITLANINKDLCLVHGTWQLEHSGS